MLKTTLILWGCVNIVLCCLSLFLPPDVVLGVEAGLSVAHFASSFGEKADHESLALKEACGPHVTMTVTASMQKWCTKHNLPKASMMN